MALEETGTSPTATFSPLAELLTEHVAPERLYLEAKWAALISMASAPDCWQTSYLSTSL